MIKVDAEVVEVIKQEHEYNASCAMLGGTSIAQGMRHCVVCWVIKVKLTLTNLLELKVVKECQRYNFKLFCCIIIVATYLPNFCH